MADTPTANYGLNVPTDGADDDVWGVLTNENWATLDATLKAMQDQIDANLLAAQLPIGTVLGTDTADNPGDVGQLGYGTWVAFALNNTLVGAGDAYALGATGGSSVHTLTEAELASHDHTDSFSVAAVGDHTHPMFDQAGISGSPGTSSGTRWVGISTNNNLGAKGTDAGGAHSHTLNGKVNNAGSGSAHNNMQPYIAINYWKRTA